MSEDVQLPKAYEDFWACLLKHLFHKTVNIAYCWKTRENNKKSLVYLRKLSKAFDVIWGGSTLLIVTLKMWQQKEWHLFQLVAEKTLIVLLAFFAIIKIWWKEKSLCIHMDGCRRNELLCWKVPMVLPWWDACAGPSDCWLVCWAVPWVSRAGARFSQCSWQPCAAFPESLEQLFSSTG